MFTLRSYLFVLSVIPFVLPAQLIQPYTENGKWGFKRRDTILIPAQYDTVFHFDRSNRIALIGNINPFITKVNPLTGESEPQIDYSFITPANKRLMILPNNFPDSISVLPNQQELTRAYQDSSDVFRILFHDKVYLFSKNGKQLSEGFDNISFTVAPTLFFTELVSEYQKQIVRMHGLISSAGKTIVKCRYNTVSINKSDSLVYCCGVLPNKRANDDVFSWDGVLKYTTSDHLEYASRHIRILKTYEPEHSFIVENAVSDKKYSVKGSELRILNHREALVVNESNWLLIDLFTGKSQKVDKEKYFRFLNTLWN